MVVDDVAYFGSTEGRLYAVNARTGNVRWAYNTGGRINASPSDLRGADLRLDVRRLDLLPGQAQRPEALEHVRQAEHFSYESFYASASTDGARLYTTSRAGKIVALSAKSGRVLWTYQMGNWGYATPAIADGRVYVGGFDSQLRAFRATDGKLLWDGPSAAGSSPPPSSSATSSSCPPWSTTRGPCASPTARSSGSARRAATRPASPPTGTTTSRFAGPAVRLPRREQPARERGGAA